MYGRVYGDRELTFEASGGLIHGSLVMQDRETDSYWPIMAGRSIRGELEGTRLEELTVARKVRWSQWRAEHPDTLILSVNGREDQPSGYHQYFASEQGFRGLEAADRRLDTKAPIYAFRIDGRPFAVAHAAIAERARFDVADLTLFFHRPAQAELFDSTLAVIIEAEPCVFDADSGELEPDGCATPLTGFDTFWYNWSLNNPETEVLRAGSESGQTR